MNLRPYIFGALTGLLAIGSVWVSTTVLGKAKYLGTSTTLVTIAGYIESQVAPERVASNPYYQKTTIQIDWQAMLVLGVLLGAFGASQYDSSYKLETVPSIWKERFGASIGIRAFGALVGGAIAAFGVRMAGGCPSGHGLSGMMQLSLSGFIAAAAFFTSGIFMAKAIYGGKR